MREAFVVFSPAVNWQWPITLIIAIFLTTSIEAGVVMWVFKIAMDRRRFAVLALANAVSVAIAFVSVMTKAPRM